MDQVEEVKNKIDVVQLVGEYVKLTKAGRNYKGLCPFHGEKTPSFMVNPELSIYKCFGCGEGGDVISFIQKMEGIEFGEALKILAKRAGITLKSYVPTKGEEERETLLRANGLAADYFHFLLTKHDLGRDAKKYLLDRGITEESITRYKLGFAPEGWDYLIKFLADKKGFKLLELERAGLVVPSVKGNSGGYDRFRNRIMFPLCNHRGQVVGFAGRVLPGADEKAGGKYVNTSETELYHKGDLLYGLDVNKSEIKSKNSAVIVEGEIDSIASFQAGVGNVVAIKGSALTARQVELLKRYTDTIILALDADLAGDMAARRGIELAEKAGMIIKVVEAGSLKTNPKKYKDPGEWAIKDGEGWKNAVEEAVGIYDFYITSAVERHGLEAVGKTKVGKELLPIWARIEDEIVKGHYVKKLAGMLGVAEEDVRKQMNKTAGSGGAIKPGLTEDKLEQKRSRREVVEEYAVGLAVRNNKLEELVSPFVAELFRDGFWAKVVEDIKGNLDGERTVKDIVGMMKPELRGRIEELTLIEEELLPDEVEKEWKSAVDELEEATIREKLSGLLGLPGKEEEVTKLVFRLNELTRSR
jgi:DNA primase